MMFVKYLDRHTGASSVREVVDSLSSRQVVRCDHRDSTKSLATQLSAYPSSILR